MPEIGAGERRPAAEMAGNPLLARTDKLEDGWWDDPTVEFARHVALAPAAIPRAD